MSIVSMQRMSIVAHNSERSKLLRTFIKLGCIEVINNEEVKPRQKDRENRDRIEAKKFRVIFALNFMREMSKEMLFIDKKAAPKVNLKKDNSRVVPLEEYEEIGDNDVEVFAKIDELERINNQIVDIRSEKTRLNALREQLNIYKDLSIALDLAKDTKSVSVLVGTIPTQRAEELKASIPEDVVCEIHEYEKLCSVAVICHLDKKEEIMKVLNDLEFIRTSLSFSTTARAKIDEIDARIKEIDEQNVELIKSALNYTHMIPTLKIMHDFYQLEIAKVDYVSNSTRTQKVTVLEAWVPKDKVKTITDAINEKCNKVEMVFRDPLETETPPTLVQQSKVTGPFVNAFTGITDMFGSPNYRERDPNLFVAFFYFLIFGIMLGDAGYGLIMAIACFVFLKVKKPVKKSGQMIMMFGICGISTFIWGALLGGWFAIDISGTFLEKIKWFSPLDEPLKMFMLSLAVGVLQIGTGFALSGIAKIETKDKVNIAKGIFSDFGWVVVFLGLLCLFPNVMVYLKAIEAGPTWYGIAGQVGMYMAIAGFVMIIIGGAIGKKNPVKMVGGALGSIYGAINVVSDLLSYSRLFGLGLTSGVIGLVMNELGMIMVDMMGPIGWIPAVVVFVGGHVFNLAINLLGAYVHDSRLQYIEFFGRFYDGSGRAFKPLGENVKYTYLDN